MLSAKTAADLSVVKEREYLRNMERLVNRRVRRRAKAGHTRLSFPACQHLDQLVTALERAGYEVEQIGAAYRNHKLVGYWGIRISWGHHHESRTPKREPKRMLKAV